MTKAEQALKGVIKISEDKLQASEIVWFRAQYPQYTYRLFAIPNSGKRSIATAMNMKRTGQLRGAWDIFLSIPRGKHAGLYIENKVGYNTLTDEQKEFKSANENEYAFEVCKTLEQFITTITNYLTLKSKL